MVIRSNTSDTAVAGSDVALETADIALMATKLTNLPFAIGLSKKGS